MIIRNILRHHTTKKYSTWWVKTRIQNKFTKNYWYYTLARRNTVTSLNIITWVLQSLVQRIPPARATGPPVHYCWLLTKSLERIQQQTYLKVDKSKTARILDEIDRLPMVLVNHSLPWTGRLVTSNVWPQFRLSSALWGQTEST